MQLISVGQEKRFIVLLFNVHRLGPTSYVPVGFSVDAMTHMMVTTFITKITHLRKYVNDEAL